ncbi:MAG TPA: hypothetical protein VNL71_15185 [Chloroflexota bacterium]|nr:hypothetical protein [Chloroflexota bacterium]
MDTRLAAQEEMVLSRVLAAPAPRLSPGTDPWEDDRRSVQDWRNDLFDAGRKAWNAPRNDGQSPQDQPRQRHAIVALVTLALDLVDCLDRERTRAGLDLGLTEAMTQAAAEPAYQEIARGPHA